MKKIALLSCFCLVAGILRLSAQSLSHTSWKGYFGDPLNDTITLRFLVDEESALSSAGDTLAHSKITFSGDTLRFNDIDGRYACMDMQGVYRFSVQGDVLSFTLVTDPCEGRGNIASIAWKKVMTASGKP